MIFDNRRCELGEGPLWHPLREQLFWFDIVNQRLLTQEAGLAREWRFPKMVSAAGWISHDELLIADEDGLFLFDLRTEETSPVAALEAENRRTRSNDGRADPQGGFWIGTMGKQAEPGAGAIWRYWRGEMRRLFAPMTIPNAISFAPGGRSACFTDTVTGRVMRVALDAQGWPSGQPEVWLDLSAEGLNPDGAVIDSDGVMWIAEWGAARVAAYSPQGERLRVQEFDAPHTSCPAFGGPYLSTLFCTSALQGMDPTARKAHPAAGTVMSAPSVARGQPECCVTLGPPAIGTPSP